MFVGNIVIQNKLNIDKYFNVVESMDDIIHGLPTLIVGWDIIKTIEPDADFITRKLSDNTFWTFKKTERRDIFENDLYDFIHYSYNLLVTDVDYKFIDLIQLTELQLKITFKRIKKSTKSVGYIHENMLYIYSENVVYGLDLKLVNYLEYNLVETLNKIKSYCSVFLDNDEILIEYKDIIDMLNNEVKYVPFLYSIEHG